jgi:hypothetical protein
VPVSQTLSKKRQIFVDLGPAIDGRLQSRVLSIVLSIGPGRSRHPRIAKAANRAIHLGFSGILP